MPIGRDFVKAIIRCSSDEARLTFGDQVQIKKLDGVDAGNPAQGISPTYTFVTLLSRAVISSLTQNDVMKSGGIYQLGDITVSLNEELTEVSDKTRGIGDRMIWRDNEYRIVGKKHNKNIADRDHLFTYVMRKVE